MQKALKFCILVHLGDPSLPEVNFIFSFLFHSARLFIQLVSSSSCSIKTCTQYNRAWRTESDFSHFFALSATKRNNSSSSMQWNFQLYVAYALEDVTWNSLNISAAVLCVSSADFSPQHWPIYDRGAELEPYISDDAPRYMGEIDDETRNSEFGSTLIEKIYTANRGWFGKKKNEKIEKNVLFCENLLHPPRNLDAFIYIFLCHSNLMREFFVSLARRARCCRRMARHRRTSGFNRLCERLVVGVGVV